MNWMKTFAVDDRKQKIWPILGPPWAKYLAMQSKIDLLLNTRQDNTHARLKVNWAKTLGDNEQKPSFGRTGGEQRYVPIRLHRRDNDHIFKTIRTTFLFQHRLSYGSVAMPSSWFTEVYNKIDNIDSFLGSANS